MARHDPDPRAYDRIADAYAHLGIPRPDLRDKAKGANDGGAPASSDPDTTDGE